MLTIKVSSKPLCITEYKGNIFVGTFMGSVYVLEDTLSSLYKHNAPISNIAIQDNKFYFSTWLGEILYFELEELEDSLRYKNFNNRKINEIPGTGLNDRLENEMYKNSKSERTYDDLCEDIENGALSDSVNSLEILKDNPVECGNFDKEAHKQSEKRKSITRINRGDRGTNGSKRLGLKFIEKIKLGESIVKSMYIARDKLFVSMDNFLYILEYNHIQKRIDFNSKILCFCGVGDWVYMGLSVPKMYRYNIKTEKIESVFTSHLTSILSLRSEEEKIYSSSADKTIKVENRSIVKESDWIVAQSKNYYAVANKIKKISGEILYEHRDNVQGLIECGNKIVSIALDETMIVFENYNYEELSDLSD